MVSAEDQVVAEPEPQHTVSELRAMMGEELRTLSTAELIERSRFFRGAGVTFGGDRDLYAIFGYNDLLTAVDYRARFERGGVAGRIVDALPKATWRGNDGGLIEDKDPAVSTAFEKDWKSIDRRVQVWAKFCRADILSRVTSFAVVLIGVKDAAGATLETPLPHGKGDPNNLIFLSDPFMGGAGPSVARGLRGRPVRESDLMADATIVDWVKDVSDPRFGKPLFYQLKRSNTVMPMTPQRVHWSRILHFADGCLDDEVYGEPALRRPWNNLDDLEKVTGGGAEAFFLRANKGTQFDIDAKVKGLTTDEKDDFKTQIDAYVHGISRVLRTRGVNVTDLGSAVADFSSPADAILTQIAGTVAIPKRILTGAEAGELASSQDRENWRDQVIGRQTGYAEPRLLRQLGDRLLEYGYLTPTKTGEYFVDWPHTQVLTEDERYKGALGWAMVNQAQGQIVFTEDEIRDKWYGLEPLPQDIKDKLNEQMLAMKKPPMPVAAPGGKGLEA